MDQESTGKEVAGNVRHDIDSSNPCHVMCDDLETDTKDVDENGSSVVVDDPLQTTNDAEPNVLRDEVLDPLQIETDVLEANVSCNQVHDPLQPETNDGEPNDSCREVNDPLQTENNVEEPNDILSGLIHNALEMETDDAQSSNSPYEQATSKDAISDSTGSTEEISVGSSVSQKVGDKNSRCNPVEAPEKSSVGKPNVIPEGDTDPNTLKDVSVNSSVESTNSALSIGTDPDKSNGDPKVASDKDLVESTHSLQTDDADEACSYIGTVSNKSDTSHTVFAPGAITNPEFLDLNPNSPGDFNLETSLSDGNLSNLLINCERPNSSNIDLSIVKAEPLEDLSEKFDLGDYLTNTQDVRVKEEVDMVSYDEMDLPEVIPPPVTVAVSEVRYRVHRNVDMYSREQLHAAKLISQSTLSTVVDMDMFDNVGKSMPVVNVRKLENCVQNLDVCHENYDSLFKFSVQFGKDPLLWRKIFKNRYSPDKRRHHRSKSRSNRSLCVDSDFEDISLEDEIVFVPEVKKKRGRKPKSESSSQKTTVVESKEKKSKSHSSRSGKMNEKTSHSILKSIESVLSKTEKSESKNNAELSAKESKHYHAKNNLNEQSTSNNKKIEKEHRNKSGSEKEKSRNENESRSHHKSKSEKDHISNSKHVKESSSDGKFKCEKVSSSKSKSGKESTGISTREKESSKKSESDRKPRNKPKYEKDSKGKSHKSKKACDEGEKFEGFIGETPNKHGKLLQHNQKGNFFMSEESEESCPSTSVSPTCIDQSGITIGLAAKFEDSDDDTSYKIKNEGDSEQKQADKNEKAISSDKSTLSDSTLAEDTHQVPVFEEVDEMVAKNENLGESKEVLITDVANVVPEKVSSKQMKEGMVNDSISAVDTSSSKGKTDKKDVDILSDTSSSKRTSVLKSYIKVMGGQKYTLRFCSVRLKDIAKRKKYRKLVDKQLKQIAKYIKSGSGALLSDMIVEKKLNELSQKKGADVQDSASLQQNKVKEGLTKEVTSDKEKELKKKDSSTDRNDERTILKKSTKPKEVATVKPMIRRVISDESSSASRTTPQRDQGTPRPRDERRRQDQDDSLTPNLKTFK